MAIQTKVKGEILCGGYIIFGMTFGDSTGVNDSQESFGPTCNVNQ